MNRNFITITEIKFFPEQKDIKQRLKEIVTNSIVNSEEILSHAIHEVDNPALAALQCSPDYLRSLTQGCREALEESRQIPETNYCKIINTASKIAHRHSFYILQGKATSNASPDISFGDSKYIPNIPSILF